MEFKLREKEKTANIFMTEYHSKNDVKNHKLYLIWCWYKKKNEEEKIQRIQPILPSGVLMAQFKRIPVLCSIVVCVCEFLCQTFIPRTH